MKLDRGQLAAVIAYVAGYAESVPSEILDGAEIELGDIRPRNRGKRSTDALAENRLREAENQNDNRTVLDTFRRGEITSIRIGVTSSWECIQWCGQKLMQKTCKDDPKSTTVCELSLKRRCFNSRRKRRTMQIVNQSESISP